MNVDIESNADELGRLLDQLIAGFDFTRPGKDQSLGRDLAGVAAKGILDRSVPDARAPDGATWADNTEPYRTRKRKKYDADQPGKRTGQMLSLQSVMGETTVERDQVEMRYGIGAPPDRAANGTDLTKGDLAVTDREKAAFFTAGGRVFFGLDATINEAIQQAASDALSDYLKE